MGVVYIWKHSEGVVSDAVACVLVTVSFSIYLFVGGSSVCRYHAAFRYSFLSEPNTLFILYDRLPCSGDKHLA